MKKLIQVHSHIFNAKDISEGFIGVKLPFSYSFLHTIEGGIWLISKVCKLFYSKEKLSNYKNFIDCFNDLTMQKVYDRLKSYDTEPTVHCVLAMDTISIKGKIKTDITDEILELGEIKKNNPDFMFFVAIDPNRDTEQIKQLLELSFNAGASGYKLYPSLGYIPTHPNLMNIIYPFCISHSWPVTAHCSSSLTRASAQNLRIIGLDNNGNPINEVRKMNKEAYRQLNNPQGYVQVLKQFPTLHLNLAHFGGSEIEKLESNQRSWCTDILSLMQQYENVYTDISYSFSNRKEMLKIVQILASNELFRNRCLLGTDFYMVLLEGSYRDLLGKLFLSLGDTLINQLGRENPVKFLNYK